MKKFKYLWTVLAAAAVLLCAQGADLSADMGQVQDVTYGSGKCSPWLLDKMETMDSSGRLNVILTLTEQPLSRIAEEVRYDYSGLVEGLENELREINRIESHSAELTADKYEERELAAYKGYVLSDEQYERKQAILEELDDLRTEINHEIGRHVEAETREQQEEVASLLESWGCPVLNRVRLTNAISSNVPGEMIPILEADPDVMWIDLSHVREGHLNTSICTVGADTSFWDEGYTGASCEGGILDSGVDEDHPAFSWKSFQSHVSLATGSTSPYFDDVTSSNDDLHGHGTHVTGIVCSNDSTYPGVAYNDNNNVNLKAAYNASIGGAFMNDDDAMAAVDWALFDASDDAEVFNLSYGSTASSDDNSYCRFWDSVVDDMGCMVTISAGNSGPTGRVGSPSIAYNCMSVANINNKNDCSTSNDEWHSSSSIGPTLGYRSKPDIGAPGKSIKSANNNWEGISANFVNMTGTSMAAPHVAGACLLLADYGITSPREQKALLLNTADDVENIGVWNKYYGHGALDLDHAWYHRNDVFTDYVYDSRYEVEDRYRLYTGHMYEDDRITMVRNRHADYNGDYPTDYYDLSNINLYLYRETTNAMLDADTGSTDNVCMVEQEDYSGVDVVAKVRSYGEFEHNSGWDFFAMATEEGFEPAEVDLSVSLSRTTYDFIIFYLVEIVVSVTNDGNVRAHDCDVVLDIPDDWTWYEGYDGTMNIGDVDPGETVECTFIAADDELGFYSLTAEVESLSYGETFSDSVTRIYRPMIPLP